MGVSVENAIDLLHLLQDLGIDLQVREDRIGIWPKDAVTHEGVEALRRAKPVLIPLLEMLGADCVIEVDPRPFSRTWPLRPRDLQEPGSDSSEPPGHRCFACKGGTWWKLSEGNEWCCSRCHPPQADRESLVFHEVEGA